MVESQNEAHVAYFLCRDCGYRCEPFVKADMESHLAWHAAQNVELKNLGGPHVD